MELITILNRCHRFRGFVAVEEVPWGDGKRSAIHPRPAFPSPTGAHDFSTFSA
jgi:hypothetical protein